MILSIWIYLLVIKWDNHQPFLRMQNKIGVFVDKSINFRTLIAISLSRFFSLVEGYLVIPDKLK